MQSVKDIAKELSKGNVKAASALRSRVPTNDCDLQGEVVEVARQAIFSSIKKGEVKEARDIERHFEIPEDLANEAIKQAMLSIYAEGDFKAMLDIEREAKLPKAVREDIVAYCKSWGLSAEADVLREALVG